ncbi:MAG: hypothetical protein ABWY09_09230 [Stenotrophomonas maltophilia]
MHRNLVMILAVSALLAVFMIGWPGIALHVIAFPMIGLLPACVAWYKGYGEKFGTWWLYGSVLAPIAFIHVTFLPWAQR